MIGRLASGAVRISRPALVVRNELPQTNFETISPHLLSTKDNRRRQLKSHYSITASARPRNEGGLFNPISLAFFILRTNSSLTDQGR
jgi:hypothetical protein